jgi:hypothetical protein
MVEKRRSREIECDLNKTLFPYPKAPIFVNICPLFTVFLQFGITAMFMWMLCEGIHLNNILTVSVFKNRFKTYYFYILGWGTLNILLFNYVSSLFDSCSIMFNIKLEYRYVY